MECQCFHVSSCTLSYANLGHLGGFPFVIALPCIIWYLSSPVTALPPKFFSKVLLSDYKYLSPFPQTLHLWNNTLPAWLNHSLPFPLPGELMVTFYVRFSATTHKLCLQSWKWPWRWWSWLSDSRSVSYSSLPNPVQKSIWLTESFQSYLLNEWDHFNIHYFLLNVLLHVKEQSLLHF